MTALPTDFSVTSNRVTPTPTPDWPIDSPFAVTAVSGAGITDPGALSAVSAGSISTPVSYSAVGESAISSPSVSPAVSIAAISAPLLFSGVAAASVGSPSVYSSVSDAAITAPTTITATAGTATTPPFPLNHARILYDNLLFNYSSVTSSTGTNPSYSVIPNTYKSWQFSTTGWIKYTLTSSQSIDTVCIGAHNLANGSYTVRAFYRETAAGSLVGFAPQKTVTSNAPIMFHVDTPVNAEVIEIYTTVGTGDGQIGYVSAGTALQLQRPFFSGHTPITMGDNTVYRNNMTDGGEFTSRSIIRKGFSNSVSLDNVDRTWIQDYFLDFKEVSKEYLYFIAWNLLEYPNEVGLCMTGGDISLQFSGTRNLMSINWNQTGHGSV